MHQPILRHMKTILRKKRALHVLYLFIGMVVFTSCVTNRPPIYLYGKFKFAQKPDEINLKPALISFLKAHPQCAFVLRVPDKKNSIVEEERYSNRTLYFAIEKILLERNFNVIDRSLFEKQYTVDSLRHPSADFILELIDNRLVNYYTNKVIPDESRNDNEITLQKYFYFVGAQAIFKITNVHTAEVVGTCVLNYTPCTRGCKMKDTLNGIIEEVSGDSKTRKKLGYESTDIDDNYEMFIELITRLVNELRLQSQKDQ